MTTTPTQTAATVSSIGSGLHLVFADGRRVGLIGGRRGAWSASVWPEGARKAQLLTDTFRTKQDAAQAVAQAAA